nr:MAG TPA: Head fiber protein [Caudoviricetes sp.]
MGYLSNAGLSYFFGKLKTIFAPISHGHGGATQSEAGFMSAADKKKLDGIAEGANKYSLPTATSSVLGGVKTGANITNNSGVLSVTADNVKNALGYTPPEQDTNTWRPVVNNLTSDSTTDSLSAAQGKALKTLIDGKAASNHTHTKSQITDFPALGTVAVKNVRTLTTQGASGWKDAATDQQYVPDMSFIAYWNGAYSGTSSNLVYCYRGAFGTIVTKNTSDYAVAGHTHTWDSVTGKPSTFTPSSHTHGVIKSLSVNGTTITCTKDDGTTSTITTQDTNTTYGTFKGATTSEAGSTGLVIAPVAGNANRYLRSDGTWAVPPDTNTTYGVFAKATADAAGSTGLVPAPAKGQQTYYLRGDGTWAVPANTWRGIQDNLTSSSITDSLSANQGKVLKGLIDGKAASGHTHNYAGSSSAGGAATSANKVNAALTINLNGTSQGAWDGSSVKSISITAASVGATSVTISRW